MGDIASARAFKRSRERSGRRWLYYACLLVSAGIAGVRRRCSHRELAPVFSLGGLRVSGIWASAWQVVRGRFDGAGPVSPVPVGMTYVVDVKDPRNEESLEGFPMTLADEEIRDWWATLCRGPVTDLPTADEVAIEYALSYEGKGSVAVVHKDGGGQLIDTGLFAREIR